jgi:hypothetical protein
MLLSSGPVPDGSGARAPAVAAMDGELDPGSCGLAGRNGVLPPLLKLSVRGRPDLDGKLKSLREGGISWGTSRSNRAAGQTNQSFGRPTGVL